MSDNTQIIDLEESTKINKEVNKGCSGQFSPLQGKVVELTPFSIDLGGMVHVRGMGELSYSYYKKRGWFTQEQQRDIELFFLDQMTHARLTTQVARIFANVFEAVSISPKYTDPEGDNVTIFTGDGLIGFVGCRVTYGAGAFGIRSVKGVDITNNVTESIPVDWLAALSEGFENEELAQTPLDPALENEEAWR